MTSKSEIKRKATLDPIGMAERMFRLEQVAEAGRKTVTAFAGWESNVPQYQAINDLDAKIRALDSSRVPAEGGEGEK